MCLSSAPKCGTVYSSTRILIEFKTLCLNVEIHTEFNCLNGSMGEICKLMEIVGATE